MSYRYLTIMLLAGVSLTAIAGKDENKETSGTKISFSKARNDSTRHALFDLHRPHGNKDIPVPHFCIHTDDHRFALTIGGQVNPILGVDLGNDLYDQKGAGINFTTNSIPVPAIKGHKSDFYINALNADVDFQVVGFGGSCDQITGYIKIGASGNTNDIQLKDCYASWRGFTAGRKTTLFKDELAAQPPTIDPQGPSGEVSATAYEVSYISPAFRNGLRFAFGLATPTYYHSSGRYYGPDYQDWLEEGEVVADPNYYSQNVPDFPVWVEWAESKYNRIRLSGIVRNFIYRDEVEQKRRHAFGWGVMVSGNWNPIRQLVFNMQAIYGHGIGNYIQDLAGLPLSFTPSQKQVGKMSANPMMGLVLGASYTINKRWQVNAVASEARIWKVGPYAKENATEEGHFNDYKYGFYFAANAFYNISSYLQVGMEYLYGRRGTWNVGSGFDNRIQTQFMLTF
ncbi:MAG: hypothetical protein K2J70_06180 [Muribaculaceae bacterium]|nr:hypothetical protein [Muribaculaceae bacterium]